MCIDKNNDLTQVLPNGLFLARTRWH